jgi:hypothetical protein
LLFAVTQRRGQFQRPLPSLVVLETTISKTISAGIETESETSSLSRR